MQVTDEVGRLHVAGELLERLGGGVAQHKRCAVHAADLVREATVAGGPELEGYFMEVVLLVAGRGEAVEDNWRETLGAPRQLVPARHRIERLLASAEAPTCRGSTA